MSLIGYSLGKAYSVLVQYSDLLEKSTSKSFCPYREKKIQHQTATFAFSLIFPFQPFIDNQTINLQNTTVQINGQLC